MSFFDDVALPFVLAEEGGYSDDPVDRGGATMKGITQRTYDAWNKTHGKPVNPVKYITDTEIAAIYHSNYWVAAHCDQMPECVALVVFDGAVQHGPGTSIKLLQKALSVMADGIFGKDTLAALQDDVEVIGARSIAEQYIDQRDIYYDKIVAHDAAQSRFRKGWQNRLTALETVVHEV